MERLHIMKFTVKYIGLLSVLLFSMAHAEAPAEKTVETVLADACFATPLGEAVQATPTEADSAEVVTGEVIKQATHLEEIKANLSEVNTALKAGIQAVATVANGVVDAAGAVLRIASGVIVFSIAVTKITWFTAKVIYIAANAVAEFSQTTFAASK